MVRIISDCSKLQASEPKILANWYECKTSRVWDLRPYKNCDNSRGTWKIWGVIDDAYSQESDTLAGKVGKNGELLGLPETYFPDHSACYKYVLYVCATGTCSCAEEEICPDIDWSVIGEETPLSTMQMAKNLASSAANWAANGFEMSDDKTLEVRKAACDSCVYWEDSARLGMGKCQKCGCTSLKLKLATEKCPIGKW